VTTMDVSGLPSIPSLVLMRLASALSSRSRTKAKRSASPVIQALTRFVLIVAGFSCLTWAGFSVSFTIGLVAASVSCFLMSWLFTGNTAQEATDTRTTMPHQRLR